MSDFQFVLPTRTRWERVKAGVVAVFRGAVLSGKMRPRSTAVTLAQGLLWLFLTNLVVAAVLVWVFLGGITNPTHAMAITWASAVQAPIRTPSGLITLSPLLFVAWPLATNYRFFGWLLRRSARPTWLVRSGISLGLLALLGGVCSAVTVGASVSVSTLWLGFCTAACGAGALLLAWRRTSGLAWRLPPALAGAAIAILGMIGLGAVLVLVLFVQSAVAGFGEGNVTSGLGLVSVFLLQLLYLPNIVLWLAAYATGAGVQVGEATWTPYQVPQLSLPDLPLTSVVGGEPAMWVAFVPLGIVAVGSLAAMATQRRSPVRVLRHRIMRAVSLGVAVGLLWIPLRLLVGGSLGDGRLDWVGPNWAVIPISALLTMFGALIWALLPTLAADAQPVAVDLRDKVEAGRIKMKRGSSTP